MSLWILDTDHVSLFQRRNPLIVQRVNGVKFEEIAITIITAEEQLRGRFLVILICDNYNKQSSNSQKPGNKFPV